MEKWKAVENYMQWYGVVAGKIFVELRWATAQISTRAKYGKIGDGDDASFTADNRQNGKPYGGKTR